MQLRSWKNLNGRNQLNEKEKSLNELSLIWTSIIVFTLKQNEKTTNNYISFNINADIFTFLQDKKNTL